MSEIAIVAVPYANDVARWGAARGPQAILDAGLIPALEADGHRVGEPVWIEMPLAERTRDIVTNLGKIASRTSLAVRTALEHGKLVIVLEGDCTHAVGAAGGLAQALVGAGVIWFDAHGDMNTLQTTSTGLWGGMPYAVILGWEFDDWRQAAGLEPPVRAEAAALVGGSDLDPAELDALDRHPIARLDAQDMQDRAAEKLSRLLVSRTVQAPGWYLHLDLDVAGPDELPGAHTPAPHWPPRQQLIAAAAAAAAAVPVRVVALAAYNPGGDPERRGARLAVDLARAVVNAAG